MEGYIILGILLVGIIAAVIISNHPKTKYNKACDLLKARKYKDAEVILNKILDKHPNAKVKLNECIYLEGKALLKAKKYSEAETLFNQIKAEHPESEKEYYNCIFQRGQILFDKKKYGEAQVIFKQLISLHQYGLRMYAECYLKEGEVIEKQGELGKAKIEYTKVLNAGKLLTSISNKDSYKNIAYLAFFRIAEIQFKSISKIDCFGRIKAYNENIDYIANSEFGNSNECIALITRHNIKIGNIYYKLGIQKEKENNLVLAKENYTNAQKLLAENKLNDTYYNSIVRNEICKLKLNENANNLSAVEKVQPEFQADFYYRYVIALLKKEKYSDAESILGNKLDKRRGEIKQLMEICHARKVINANDEITNINEKISKINNGEISTKSAVAFYNSISKLASEISSIIPGVNKELESIKPSLFNRILQGFISEEDYGKAINFILKYPKFYSSPVLLKNVGNACLNYLKKRTLTEKNYKIVISLFLTSVYSDKVMLNSLEETLWDDEYTFTLIDSIGSSFELHKDIPENVNYDEITEVNISIGESQRFLISQFENLLNDQEVKNTLGQKIHSFYDSEKKAIEKIIEIIPTEIFFATPYFAERFSLSKAILDGLERDYENYQNEEALVVGEAYNVAGINKKIQDYSKARDIKKNILTSISKVDIKSFEKHNTRTNISFLKRYNTIYRDFENALIDTLSRISKVRTENKDLLKLMKSSLNFNGTNDKLKYLYAHYSLEFCIGKINADRMTNLEGLRLMKDAYNELPNDSRICNNTVILIKLNLLDIINERTRDSRAIYSVLDYFKENKSTAFINNARELANTRTEILNQLPADARLAITTGVDLSLQGEKLKKALDYFRILGGASSSPDPLEALRSLLDRPF